MYKSVLLIAVSFTLATFGEQSALAQRDSDPNLKHFYRSRQQVQIIDESPVVTRGSAGTASSGTPKAGLPSKPLPLPAAGWQTYIQTKPPGFTTGLPKTNNGVPQSIAPPTVPSKKGQAGALAAGNKSKNTKTASKAASAPPTNSVRAYTPYQTYKPAENGAAASGSSSQQSATTVRGSLLHWARGAH